MGLFPATRAKGYKLLLSVYARHPQDLWLNILLGSQSSSPEEAIGYYRSALTIRPNEPYVLIKLADSLQKAGRHEQSIPFLLRANDFATDHTQIFMLLTRLGRAYAKRGAWDDAIAIFHEAYGQSPKIRQKELAMAYVNKCDWGEALRQFPTTEKITPSSIDKTVVHAELLVLSGDRTGYQKICDHVLEEFGASSERAVVYHVARICNLVPGAVGDIGLHVRLAEREAAVGGRVPYSKHTAGLAYYRIGDFKKAKSLVMLSGDDKPPWPGNACNWLVRAMAEHHLGNREDARHWLNKACQWIEQETPKVYVWLPPEAGKLHPIDWLEMHILRHEAEKLIIGAENSEPAPTAMQKKHRPQRNRTYQRVGLSAVRTFRPVVEAGPSD
jgi:tetratricopeptide (TPR) repeat protein